jgi:hypothetical protein
VSVCGISGGAFGRGSVCAVVDGSDSNGVVFFSAKRISQDLELDDADVVLQYDLDLRASMSG